VDDDVELFRRYAYALDDSQASHPSADYADASRYTLNMMYGVMLSHASAGWPVRSLVELTRQALATVGRGWPDDWAAF